MLIIFAVETRVGPLETAHRMGLCFFELWLERFYERI